MCVSLAARSRSRRRRGSALSAAAACWGPALQRGAGPGPGQDQPAGWGGAQARNSPRPRWRRPAGPTPTAGSTSAAPTPKRLLAAARATRAAHGSGPGRAQVGARPGTSEPRTTSVWGPPAHSSGYASRLRRSATRRTAPSVAAARGDQRGVAAQRSAQRRGAIDYQDLPGPSGACRKGPPGGPWCGPAIAAGLLARLPQLLPEPPAPTPVPLSWHGGRRSRCGGMPRRGPRKHLLACRTPERARTAVSQAPACGPACERKSAEAAGGRMAIERCRGSEGSGYATRGFANHAASRPGRRPQGGEGGLPRQELAIRGRARFHPRRPSNPRRKRRTRAPALGVPARHQPRQPNRPPVPCAQPTANPGLRAQRGAPPESALRPLRLEEGLPAVRPRSPRLHRRATGRRRRPRRGGRSARHG